MGVDTKRQARNPRGKGKSGVFLLTCDGHCWCDQNMDEIICCEFFDDLLPEGFFGEQDDGDEITIRISGGFHRQPLTRDPDVTFIRLEFYMVETTDCKVMLAKDCWGIDFELKDLHTALINILGELGHRHGYVEFYPGDLT